jgi:hypothetical protein
MPPIHLDNASKPRPYRSGGPGLIEVLLGAKEMFAMNGFLPPRTYYGQLVQNSSLSAASWGPARWDVFGTYADGTLAHWWYDDGNTGTDTIGRQAQVAAGQRLVPSGGLCAIAGETGQLDVFGVGTGGALVHFWYQPSSGGEPFGQEQLGGPLAVIPGPFEQPNYTQPWGGPSVVSPGFEAQIFAISAEGSLLRWMGTEGPETIKPPKPLAPLGGLSAVSWGPGRIDVFGAAADGTLLHWWAADESEWGALPQQVEWDLGGTLFNSPSQPSIPAVASPLSAVSWEPGRLDVFGVGSGQTLLHWWYFFDPDTQSGGWNGGSAGPESLGGRITGGPLAVSTRNTPGSLDVFAPGISPESTGGAPMLLRWWYRFDPATSSGGWNDGSPDPQAFTDPLTDGPIGPPLACTFTVPNLLQLFSCDQLGYLVWWESPS